MEPAGAPGATRVSAHKKAPRVGGALHFDMVPGDRMEPAGAPGATLVSAHK